MGFPLDELAVAIAARAETLTRLGFAWHTRPVAPNHGKPVVSTEFESPAWLAEITIWDSGEAELAAIRRTDDRMVNKHYDLTGRDDLDALLDHLIALVADDQVPADAVVATLPPTAD